MHIFMSLLANISNNKIVNILNKYVENNEIYDSLRNKHLETTKIFSIVFTVLTGFAWIASFYMAFVFNAVNIKQSLLFLIGYVGIIFLDVVLFDIFCELFIAVLFALRNNKLTCFVVLMDSLNRFKSFKILAP